MQRLTELNLYLHLEVIKFFNHPVKALIQGQLVRLFLVFTDRELDHFCALQEIEHLIVLLIRSDHFHPLRELDCDQAFDAYALNFRAWNLRFDRF